MMETGWFVRYREPITGEFHGLELGARSTHGSYTRVCCRCIYGGFSKYPASAEYLCPRCVKELGLKW